MDGKAKYVVINDGFGESAIVFDECFSHIRFKSLGKVVSAGFVEFDEEGAYCFGESITLKVKSREKEDANLINWRILRSLRL